MTLADRFDFTGRLAEEMRARQALASGKREGKIAMVNGDVVVEQEGIWDPFTGERLSPEEEAKAQAEEAEAKKRRVLRRR
jgi:hypothetical protein